jgi:hypothetical protein
VAVAKKKKKESITSAPRGEFKNPFPIVKPEGYAKRGRDSFS